MDRTDVKYGYGGTPRPLTEEELAALAAEEAAAAVPYPGLGGVAPAPVPSEVYGGPADMSQVSGYAQAPAAVYTIYPESGAAPTVHSIQNDEKTVVGPPRTDVPVDSFFNAANPAPISDERTEVTFRPTGERAPILNQMEQGRIREEIASSMLDRPSVPIQSTTDPLPIPSSVYGEMPTSGLPPMTFPPMPTTVDLVRKRLKGLYGGGP